MFIFCTVPDGSIRSGSGEIGSVERETNAEYRGNWDDCFVYEPYSEKFDLHICCLDKIFFCLELRTNVRNLIDIYRFAGLV